MTARYLELLTTPSVLRARAGRAGTALPAGHRDAASHRAPESPDARGARDALGPDEIEFVSARDSFFLASVSASGWPYVQHRGGPAGFLVVVDPGTLAFADVRGNAQLLTEGNVADDDRVALFLLDQPGRSRLKILGRATFHAPGDVPELAARTTRAMTPATPGAAGAPAGRPPAQRVVPAERIVTIQVEAFDWNCPKYLTPRWTAEEIEGLVGPLRAKIGRLAARLRAAGIDPEEDRP